MTYPAKGRADYLDLGQWNARCSMCSFKRKSGTLVKNWQGMWRCPEHNEPRQPQDFVRAVPDIQTPPWVQPQNAEVFVSQCTPQGNSAVPGEAQPGCAYPGYLSPAYVDNFFTP